MNCHILLVQALPTHKCADGKPTSPRLIEAGFARLRRDPRPRYAIETHEDVAPAAVILSLAIRDKAACELRIPKSRYDAIVLLNLIEKHTTRETLK